MQRLGGATGVATMATVIAIERLVAAGPLAVRRDAGGVGNRLSGIVPVGCSEGKGEALGHRKWRHGGS